MSKEPTKSINVRQSNPKKPSTASKLFKKVIVKKTRMKATPRLISERLKKRLSLRALAELTGLSKTYIHKIETGESLVPPEIAELIQEKLSNY